MGVFQELITRLSLDPAGYTAGKNAVIAGSHEAVLALDELIMKTEEAAATSKEMAASALESIGGAELLAPLAALASLAGGVELAKKADEAATAYEHLETRIEGVTRSAKRAHEIMEFAEKQSGKIGVFSPEEIDATAATLENLKLKTETYLPVVEKLAILTGKGAGGMEEFAEAIGLIGQGESGRALRVLERAGVTIEQLKRNGVQFSGPKEISSPAPIVLQAISKAVNENNPGLFDKMGDQAEAVARRTKNAMDVAFRQAGFAVQTFFLPMLEKGKEIIEDFSNAGIFKIFTEDITAALAIDPSKSALETGFIRVGAVVVGVAAAIRVVAQEVVDVINLAEKVVGVLNPLAQLNPISMAKTLGTPASQAGFAAAEKFIKDSEAALAKNREKKEETASGTGAQTTVSPQTVYLQQIAQNTHEMVKGLQRSALAGGDLGREGVNAVEVAGMRGSAGRKLVSALNEYFEGVYVGHQANLMRQGIR